MTLAEKRHLARVAELGCIVCRRLGYGDTLAEIHHIRSGIGLGQRSSHFKVLPLCISHHRLGGYGVAFHAGKKIWQEQYGTETELLDEINAMLGG